MPNEHLRLAVDQRRVTFSSREKSLRRALSARRRVARISADDTIEIVEQRESLITPPTPRATAGLWRVIDAWAWTHHREIEWEGVAPAPLPVPAAAMSNNGTAVNSHMLEFAREVHRGVVRLGAGVSSATVVGQLAQAFPLAQFAVATSTRDAAKRLRQDLQRAGLAATRVSTDWCPPSPGRIVIGTYRALAHPQIELEHRECPRGCRRP